MRSKKFTVNPKHNTVNMEVSTLPSNHSQQHLMNSEDSESSDPNMENPSMTYKDVSLAQWITVAILFFVNLINYMDRYTIAGVLTEIRRDFKVGDDQAGLLQTAFVISYMVCAPLFGYLGDRYSRRYIMAFGVTLWCLTTFIGSYMNHYFPFLLFRSMVGIGEASYSTIAPTIISDLFVSDLRSQMLALFYFAIPIGSGLGYIVGASAFRLMGTWPYALRVTPLLGALSVLLILFFMEDPERGEAEGRVSEERTSYSEDIRALWRNPSFMFSTLGFTCVAFVAGALAWFGPNYLELGVKVQQHEGLTATSSKMDDISVKFGVVAMLSGLIGVPLGSYLSQKLKHRYERADPLICAFGLLASAPLVFGAIILAGKSLTWCFVCMFLGELFLNLNWSIVADMTLYVVVPLRRSTAEAFQILISHAFGDAGSPYLIGLLSEIFRHSMRLASTTLLSTTVLPLLASSSSSSPGNSSSLALDSKDFEKDNAEFLSLQYALYVTSFVEVLGGVFFLLTSLYIVDDRDRARREMHGEDNPASHADR